MTAPALTHRLLNQFSFQLDEFDHHQLICITDFAFCVNWPDEEETSSKRSSPFIVHWCVILLLCVDKIILLTKYVTFMGFWPHETCTHSIVTPYMVLQNVTVVVFCKNTLAINLMEHKTFKTYRSPKRYSFFQNILYSIIFYHISLKIIARTLQIKELSRNEETCISERSSKLFGLLDQIVITD